MDNARSRGEMTERQHSEAATAGHAAAGRNCRSCPAMSWASSWGRWRCSTLLMTCVIWLTQSLRLLDLVINRGQSAPTFLYLTLLILPSLLVIILPIAFFFGTLFTLSRLNGDSELVVMASAGFSQRQLAVPVFIAAAHRDGAHLDLRLVADAAGPARAQRQGAGHPRRYRRGAAQRGRVQYRRRTGLTVFIRQLGNDGQIRGILVHDNRDAKRPDHLSRRARRAGADAGGQRA